MKIELEHSDICRALAHYLRTKKEKMGHSLSLGDPEGA